MHGILTGKCRGTQSDNRLHSVLGLGRGSHLSMQTVIQPLIKSNPRTWLTSSDLTTSLNSRRIRCIAMFAIVSNVYRVAGPVSVGVDERSEGRSSPRNSAVFRVVLPRNGNEAKWQAVLCRRHRSTAGRTNLRPLVPVFRSRPTERIQPRGNSAAEANSIGQTISAG